MGELSYSLAVADAFIEAYRKQNPQDEIKVIELFKAALPAFDFEAASAKYKIMHGKEHSPKDRRIWQGIVSLIDELSRRTNMSWRCRCGIFRSRTV